MREVVVHGSSMWPTFRDGDRLRAVPVSDTPLEEVLAEGLVVVAEHPLKRGVVMLKRVARVQPDGRLWLEGDNPDPTGSEDSHNFGPVEPARVLATVPEGG